MGPEAKETTFFSSLNKVTPTKSFKYVSCKPQLAYYVCSFAFMTSLTSNSKLSNFISLCKLIKTLQKFVQVKKKML